MAASDLLPRFYSPFLSHFSSNCFLIPSSFHEHLPRRLPKTAILMGTGGGIWKVAMKSMRDQVYFHQGWEKFVEENDLKDGEFLMFVFDGHKRYEVSIYGLDGCKQIRAAVDVEEISDDDSESDDSLDDSIDITALQVEDLNIGTENDNTLHSHDITALQVEELSVGAENDNDYSPDRLNIAAEAANTMATRNNIRCKKKSIENPDRLNIATEEANTSAARKRKYYKKNTIENPQAYLDDANNIHFETCFKNRNNELIIEGELISKHDLKFGNSVEYMDNKYGNLTARVSKWKDGRICIRQWKSIINRNKVKENDLILCELLRADDDLKVVRAIKIHIIRGGAVASTT